MIESQSENAHRNVSLLRYILTYIYALKTATVFNIEKLKNFAMRRGFSVWETDGKSTDNREIPER